jgi:hypothetical protein
LLILAAGVVKKSGKRKKKVFFFFLISPELSYTIQDRNEKKQQHQLKTREKAASRCKAMPYFQFFF